MTREEYQHRIERILETTLVSSSTFFSPSLSLSHLNEAMRYSALGGGKRVRPLLVYATGEALNVDVALLDLPAAAIEYIHAYSLVHDDLPSMDDDALRRGKPTTHLAFDEATAILAGDALQTMAFQLLSSPMQGICAENQLKILNILATASGADGMVKGQSIDLAAVGKTLTEGELETMHNHKTGALITASVEMASYCMETVAQATSELVVQQRKNLTDYSKAIGLAFQVRDDILDIQSDTETLGKQQGADIAAGKPTYPSIMGMSAAKEKLFKLHQNALDSLVDFEEEADSLREIASFIVKRIA